jgi:hypothetical protein
MAGDDPAARRVEEHGNGARRVGRLSAPRAVATSRTSMAEAIEHVAASSRGVLQGHLDVLKLEARVVAARSLRGAALLCTATIIAIGAWFGLMAALVAWIDLALPLAASLALVAAANGVLAGLLAWRGRASLRAPDSIREAGA